MNSKTIKFFLLLLLGSLLTLSNIYAEGGDKGKSGNTLEKPGSPIRAYMNINFISTLIKNTGVTDINSGQDASGLVYPKGSGQTAVYQSGFLWAANVGDPNENDPHVGGTVYREGLQSGWIDPNDPAAVDGVVPETDPRVRIWRVRPDIYYGGVNATGTEIPIVDLSNESLDEQQTAEDIRAQYDLDWVEWPANIGAPYADINGDGVYSPDPNGDGIYGMYQTKDVNGDPIDTVFQDVPGVPGADQTIWFVANDQAESRTSFMYGTQPMGLEQQCTIWGYAQTGALGNMFFRRYLLINKSDILPSGPRTFDSMYVSMWSDPDVGDSGDDYAGSDTVLSVSYAYNGKGQDAIYGGTTPAVGFDFFQGPLVTGVAGEDKNKNGVDDANDYAIFKNKRVGPGVINLPMTAAYYYINTDPLLTDPVQGSYAEGAVRWYRFMKGRIGLTNEPFIDPNTGQETPFTLPGDPVAGTGWIDGQQFGFGDRRIGMASGPFTMAPGDTQEVVVAEILAGAVSGVDRLSAISLMKFYDQIAQVAYDNFFDLPTPPPAPVVTVAELDEEIVLDWSKDNARVQLTENSDSRGYKFQGYNVYQLPTSSSSPSEGVRIATYDIIDGVGKIYDLTFDPTTGSVVELPVQFGNDVGVKRFISITEDAINQLPLANGNRYYFAVTAYNYNPEFGIVPNNLENPLRIFTLIPHSNDPGVTLGEGNGSELEITHVGTADGIVTATIVDPTVTTGDSYEVFFSSQQQIRNEEGFWIPAGTVMRKYNPNDPDTLTGTTIDIAAVFGPTSESYDLNFHLDVVHHYYGWADGVTLEFPAGTIIIEVLPFTAGGGDPDIVIIDNGGANPTVNLGVVDAWPPGTGNGIFHEGGEDWVVRVSSETPLPLSVDWTVFDDGYAGGGDPETGTTTVDEIGFESRTAELWNLQNTSAGTLTLENQSVYGGLDRWPPRSDLPQSSIDIGLDAMPIVDGFQMNVDVGFVAPINFFSVDLVADPTGTTTLSSSSNSDNLDIQNYTIFGGVISSKAIDNFGVGTDELADLQQDYEYRFNGIYEETSPGIFEVTSGGQMATVFRMISGGALADHPMNPSPGTAEPFLIRIPFEVWNVDDPENPFQVNMTFRDRERDGTERPFYAWNPVQRMYAIIVNSPYDENQVIQVDDGPDQFNDPSTWVTVHYGTNYGLGAVVKITYANPIVIGTDTYSFGSIAPAYSSSLAQDQVGKINVFPNPYYGFSSEEINKYNRFVTFNHLPEQANMRIFNLAGVLVRSIEKEDQGQFMYWDLNNEYGLPVASGLYIVYIEMPELGTTKVLKVAIIQEDQVLDRF